MNVLIQAEDYLPNIGGIANHVHSLAVGLTRLGVNVTILTTRKDVPSPRNVSVFGARELFRDNIRVLEIPIIYTPRNLLTNWQIRQRFTKKISKMIANGQCDLVHYHFWDFDARVVAPLKGVVPIIFTNHSSQFLENFEDGDAHRLLRDRISFSNAVIAPSIELKEKTIALGYPADSCYYIPNCVDTDMFLPGASRKVEICQRLGIGSDSQIILCARRAVPKNGILYFCEALDFIESTHHEIVILFAGLASRADDPNPDQYKESLWLKIDKIVQNEKKLRVIFLGQVPQEKMLDYYQASDISVLPSLREATSITGLESMACALPIVGTDVGGIPEIVTDGQSGILVPSGNPQALGNALNKLIQNDALTNSMGSAAREKAVKEFSIVRGAQRAFAVYSKTLQKWQEAQKIH